MAKSPKEDPEDTKERERERRRSILERRRATEEQADGVTSDMRSVYGISGTNNFSGKAAVGKKSSFLSLFEKVMVGDGNNVVGKRTGDDK